MARTKYAFQGYDQNTMARVAGRDVAISTKQAIEIANFLRHKKLLLAKRQMEAVAEKKQAVPYKRFTDGVGHRRGKMASGRYPVKASTAMLKLLESAETNAQAKGLNTKDLEIIHICAHKASSPVHYGRHGGREFKRTHVEIVLKESAETKTAKPKKEAPAKKAAEPKAPVIKAPEGDKAGKPPAGKKQEKQEEPAKQDGAEK